VNRTEQEGPGPLQVELHLADADATTRLGEWLGRHLRVGDVLALTGGLGAGKTTLVRGLARGLQLTDPDAVSSPTYLLVVEHDGPRPLLHADAYLPGKLDAFLQEGGLDYLLDRRAVVAIEWADRIRALLPAGALWLDLDLQAADDPRAGRTARLREGVAGAFPWLAGAGNMAAQ
jgi:tRNA threonylcarbamoyladenosine biosynthesis protein TsaE